MATYEYAHGTYIAFRDLWNTRIENAKDEVSRLNSAIRTLSGQTGFRVEAVREQLTYIKNGLNRQIARMQDLSELWSFMHMQTLEAEKDALRIIKSIDQIEISENPDNSSSLPHIFGLDIINVLKDILIEEIKPIPDWAVKKDSRGDNYYYAENGHAGFVYKYNEPGRLSCTYYTLRRLKERGLGFPFKVEGQANGGYWFSNCSDSVTKIPSDDSQNCLDIIINGKIDENGNRLHQYRLPVENVVISFPDPKPWGHVLLIDYIDENSVTFSDMYDYSDLKNGYISDQNGYNPTITKTYEQFMDIYKKNGVVSGAVILGPTKN